MIENQIEQAVRKSHCSNTGKEHACVGTCKITPDGIELNCRLCGKDSPKEFHSEKLAIRARNILKAAGLDYEALSPRFQLAVLRALNEDFCANCGRLHIHRQYQDFLTCPCGWVYSQYSHWKPAPPKTEMVPALFVPASGGPTVPLCVEIETEEAPF
jgi:hypothetical protein